MTTQVMTLLEMDRKIALAEEGSFPPSDPPPSTLGPTPSPPLTRGMYAPGAFARGALDVVIAAGRGRFRRLAMLELLGMTALVPAAVLLAAAPILLVVWVFGL